MVDSIQSTSANALLRAQQTASTQALNVTRAPATLNQARAAAVVPVKASSVPQTIKVASANSNLPRGSIVDKKV